MRSLALAALAASALSLAPPGAPRHLKTRRQAAVAEPDAKAKVSSANAKRQVGNDAFLNKDLRARARGGTGVTSKSKLKVGIVGAGFVSRALVPLCLLQQVLQRLNIFFAQIIELAFSDSFSEWSFVLPFTLRGWFSRCRRSRPIRRPLSPQR